MVKIVTLIPTHRNDGSPVEPQEWDGIVQRFLDKFGGVTVAGRTQGHWKDPKSGEVFEDVCWQVFVVVDDDRQSEVELMVKEIGRQLGQLAMYFEIQHPDIRFLDTSE